MSVFNYRAGIGNVGSYQASTKPFLSSSIHISGSGNIYRINLPYVTQFVTIQNSGLETVSDCLMRFGFSENGVASNNYIVLNNAESYSADWRVTSIYLRVDDVTASINATASIIAGLTNIEADQLPNNWSGSMGVG
tara:strand:- start:374 stop:781 length:408 start_codon:yes stop_codon:yes gene_type:complete